MVQFIKIENELEKFISDFVKIELCDSRLKIEFSEKMNSSDFLDIFNVYFRDARHYRNSVLIQNYRAYHNLGSVTDKEVRAISYKCFMKEFVERISNDLNRKFYFEKIEKKKLNFWAKIFK